jgi:hypothetical protein
LKPNSNLQANNVPEECKKIRKSYGVSMLRLETILELIPRDLTIELLKVDAQGVDLRVVKSSGKQLNRIQKVIVEAQPAVKAVELYQDGDNTQDTKSWMSKHGFELQEQYSFVENTDIDEWNLVFRNRHFTI